MEGMKLPKKEALKGLIAAMKGMQLEKIKGYKKKDDDMPAVEALMQKKGKKKDEEEEEG